MFPPLLERNYALISQMGTPLAPLYPVALGEVKQSVLPNFIALVLGQQRLHCFGMTYPDTVLRCAGTFFSREVQALSGVSENAYAAV
jgi:hypothetical protein